MQPRIAADRLRLVYRTRPAAGDGAAELRIAVASDLTEARTIVRGEVLGGHLIGKEDGKRSTNWAQTTGRR